MVMLSTATTEAAAPGVPPANVPAVAKGGNSSLSDGDVKAAVDYMVSKAR